MTAVSVYSPRHNITTTTNSWWILFFMVRQVLRKIVIIGGSSIVASSSIAAFLLCRRKWQNAKKLAHDGRSSNTNISDTPTAQTLEKFVSIWEGMLTQPEEILKRFVPYLQGTIRYALQTVASKLTLQQQSIRESCLLQEHHSTSQSQQQQQKDIIQFWFGKEPTYQHKHLWMIADPVRKATVDQQITQDYLTTLLELVSNPHTREQWCHTYQGHLACIIVLDQFSRHILRYCNNTTNDNSHGSCTLSTDDTKAGATATATAVLPTQEEIDNLAYHIAVQFQRNYSVELQSGQIPLQHYIFSLMPYRHATAPHKSSSIQYVQSCIEQSVDMQQQYNQLLSRFRNATNRRAATTTTATLSTTQSMDSNIHNTNNEHKDTNTYSLNTTHTNTTAQEQFSDEDILECFPFQASEDVMTLARSHPAVRAMQQFLMDLKIVTQSSSTTIIVISLSGGVDSMVIAFILAHFFTCPTSPLFHTKSYPHNNNNTNINNIQIFAAHVDYANRPESASEALYVKQFCQQYNIPFHSCRIEQVTRGITEREEYEHISRVVRFQLYRDIIDTATCTSSDANCVMTGVMLGHHRGDLRENVLSNACKGCGPLELSGMETVGKVEGITMWRPFLSIEKHDIFDFAHKFGVAYFKDTTPRWSTRWKLRNQLLPLLQDVYGDGCLTNLTDLALESQSCRQIFFDDFLQPFFNDVSRFPMGISFQTSRWSNQGLFFWKIVLRNLLHSSGRGMFTDKSVASFVERIKHCTTRHGWLQSRKDYGVYLEKNGTVYIFHPESFPWAKADKYCLEEKCEYTN
jgi:tRNA(Ile)-lysidine synthetase-like protein